MPGLLGTAQLDRKGTMKEFRTSDMTLVTVLSLEGHEAQRMELIDGRSVHWVYANDGAITDTVRTYQQGNSRLEPRSLVKRLTDVRKKMNRFIDQQIPDRVAEVR